jgi:hypothetical protein
MRSICFRNSTSKQKEDEKSNKISSFSNSSQKKHNYYLVLSYKQTKSVNVGSSLLRGWHGSQSTDRCSEHASNTIVVNWKWYDFLKLVGDGRSTIRWFRVQRFSDVVSTWSRFMLSSMNRHWHLFKMIVDRPSL